MHITDPKGSEECSACYGTGIIPKSSATSDHSTEPISHISDYMQEMRSIFLNTKNRTVFQRVDLAEDLWIIAYDQEDLILDDEGLKDLLNIFLFGSHYYDSIRDAISKYIDKYVMNRDAEEVNE